MCVGGVRAAGVEPAARLWAAAARPECARRGKTSLRRWCGLRAVGSWLWGAVHAWAGGAQTRCAGYRYTDIGLAARTQRTMTLPCSVGAHGGWIGGAAWEDAEGHRLQVN